MKIPKTCSPSAAAATDLCRYALTFAYLDVKASRLIVTNGKILAAIPVEVEDGDVDGLIDLEPLNRARVKGVSLKCGAKTLEVQDGPTWPRPTTENSGPYPKWRRVLPKISGRSAKVTFDIELLEDLARAAGPGRIATLRFMVDAAGQAAVTAIEVGLGGAPGRVAGDYILMPITVETPVPKATPKSKRARR